MPWINVNDRFPIENGYYKCISLGFFHPITCKFFKEKNGTQEWYPNHFIYRKRLPRVIYWLETCKEK
jgi:hypothetical protein